jgi:hypothetical protein
MKISKYILLLSLVCGAFSCMDLDVPSMNVVQDKDIFGSEAGINSYLARVYSGTPMEDFRYTPARGFNMFWAISPFSALTGEAISRDQWGPSSENTKYWGSAYSLIRDIDYFLTTLPTYKKNFSQTQIDTWTGEMYFCRAFTYFELVKRYGGVPIVNQVLKYPEQSIDELRIPRSSESATYDSIKVDLEKAYNLLPEKNQVGRATKYAAAGLESRAMLTAGSIAKYNQIALSDKNGNRLCGIASERAASYFKAAYDASKLLEGHFSLYKSAWKANDKEAQYQNYVNLFFDASSSENILVRQYSYPTSVHGYDCYNIPRQFMVGGYSAETNPTLDFVEMFDGLPKNADGTIKTLDSNGKYILYDNLTDMFANVEPRLRATVIYPGDTFKGEAVEIWRGIYTGDASNGISPLLTKDESNSATRYENAGCKSMIVTSKDGSQTAYQLPNGKMMNPAGRSGVFYNDGTNALTGFTVRKYLNPKMAAGLVVENHSDQTWIEMRYAEILLNRAEAAYELYQDPTATSSSYRTDAYNCINQIRERAGATLLSNESELNPLVILKERRKELSFENKIWWDLKRWRIIGMEQNGTLYRCLMPFYAANVGKWFFDATYLYPRYTFDTRWYYEDIPGDEITKNQIIQNPGY